MLETLRRDWNRHARQGSHRPHQINRLLEAAGWRYFSEGAAHANIRLEPGNPHLITSYPTPGSVIGYRQSMPDPQRLVDERINDDTIVLTQRLNYASEAGWRNEAERPGYIQANKLRFLRPTRQTQPATSEQSGSSTHPSKFSMFLSTVVHFMVEFVGRDQNATGRICKGVPKLEMSSRIRSGTSRTEPLASWFPAGCRQSHWYARRPD